MSKLIELKSEKGKACEDVLQIIFPRRVMFTATQVTDAGRFINRLGFDKVQQIAQWAARKASIKDGRYDAWLRTCRKEISAQRSGQ